MGYRTEHKQIYHMTCDICGKKEEIIETDSYNKRSWEKRKWSAFRFDYYIGIDKRKYKCWGNRNDRRITLCPECTKKLQKLLKNINFEEDFEV